MKYNINQGYITQKIAGKIAIFAGEESILHTLNETAAYMFQGIKLGWDNQKIITGLITKFGATPIEAKKDLEEFIELLIKKNILIKE